MATKRKRRGQTLRGQSRPTTDERRAALTREHNESAALASRPAHLVMVQPAIVQVLDQAKRIAAREFAYMEEAQMTGDGEPMALSTAKSFQALIQSLALTQQMESKAKEENLADLTEDQLDAKLIEAIDAVRGSDGEK